MTASNVISIKDCLLSENAKTSSMPASVEKWASFHEIFKETVLRCLGFPHFSDIAKFSLREKVTGGEVPIGCYKGIWNEELCSL